jgi:hypothetical protein
MAKDVYLIGGPAAGRVVKIPDDQKTITVQYMKQDTGPESQYAECRYEPKQKSDLIAHEFHWMGDY